MPAAGPASGFRMPRQPIGQSTGRDSPPIPRTGSHAPNRPTTEPIRRPSRPSRHQPDPPLTRDEPDAGCWASVRLSRVGRAERRTRGERGDPRRCARRHPRRRADVRRPSPIGRPSRPGRAALAAVAPAANRVVGCPTTRFGTGPSAGQRRPGRWTAAPRPVTSPQSMPRSTQTCRPTSSSTSRSMTNSWLPSPLAMITTPAPVSSDVAECDR